MTLFGKAGNLECPYHSDVVRACCAFDFTKLWQRAEEITSNPVNGPLANASIAELRLYP